MAGEGVNVDAGEGHTLIARKKSTEWTRGGTDEPRAGRPHKLLSRRTTNWVTLPPLSSVGLVMGSQRTHDKMGPEGTAGGDETASYPTDAHGARQRVPHISACLYVERLYNRTSL